VLTTPRKNRTTLIPNKVSRTRKSARTSSKSLKSYPEIVIFDIDGVLVDVRESFHRTVLEAVRHFTGKRVTAKELHEWKNKSGFNDDWKLSTAWVRSLGGNSEYDEVKRKFVEFYWGSDGMGNVAREKWLLPRANLRRLAKHSELALFTGRVRLETDYTLDRCRVREFFTKIVTVEDVERPKPDPGGLLKILNGRDPLIALYLGDNVDDAIASQSAGIPFVGILPHGSARHARGTLLLKFGAEAVLRDVRKLEPWLERFRAAPGARTSLLPRA
jgi:HAD superfamily phosphatase